ncbi:MAG: hypothetical protein JF623_01330 [Acidobacteria bacterium]|nr:hypothetical protein [Acidobacteriota bacterium]
MARQTRAQRRARRAETPAPDGASRARASTVVVVLVACIVVGVYLYANDLVWKRFVQNVLLR